MQKCIFYTCAYNAEATLQRTITSICTQTYKHWDYFIIDNGSTDNTAKITEKFAKEDGRIILLKNEKNMVFKKENILANFGAKYNDDVFFCVLDSDDEYKPEFLEKMLDFAQANTLDVVSCGHDFVDALDGNITYTRVLEENLILEGGGFSEHFTTYHQFMRTWWCKLFPLGIIRKSDLSRRPYVPYGGDTLYTQEMFRKSNRVGIMAESLHRYYLSPKSSSYRWNPRRVEADRILNNTARMFLTDKCGEVTPKNDEFLLKVYFNAIKDTIDVLLNAKIELRQALEVLHNILIYDETERMISWQGFQPEKAILFKRVAEWISSQKGSMDGANAEVTLEIYDAMGI